MTVWIGVFATATGWRVAGPVAQALYLDRVEAIGAAIHMALLAEWRGDDAGVLAQANSWGALAAIDLRSQRNRLRPFH